MTLPGKNENNKNETPAASNSENLNGEKQKKEVVLSPGWCIDWEMAGDFPPRFVLRTEREVLLAICLLTDNIIRITYGTDGGFEPDFSYAIDPEFEGDVKDYDYQEEEYEFVIYTYELVIRIMKEDLKVKFYDRSGMLINADGDGFVWRENKAFGGNYIQNRKHYQVGENFYGLGDKTGPLNLAGKKYQLWSTDAYDYGADSDPLYKNIPFYMGLHHGIGYGLFFDNSFRTWFDFGGDEDGVVSFGADEGALNYYFIYGPELVQVAADYTFLTGRPELPPLWALGYHQSKWSYYPESNIKDLAKKFRENLIPCDAIYLDIDYMNGYRCFTWNKDYFPDPAGMIRDLKAQGFKTVVIIDPGIKIDKDYWVCREGLENDYFCRRGDGPLMKGEVWPGPCYFPDFTRKDVRNWWSGLYHGLIKKDGVEGVWNDMNEPAVFDYEGKYFPNDVRHDYEGNPCSHRKAHNVYGMQMVRATFKGVKHFNFPNRPFTITRSCYAGVQRFSSVWTGDNRATWEHLTIANVQCQRLSISGVSFAGSDIGGFVGTPEGELYLRWLQLAVFHPFFRTHTQGQHVSGTGEGATETVGDEKQVFPVEQEPWSFGQEYTDIARKIIGMRYQLLPYLYTTFWQYSTYGIPMLRPLVMVDQEDSATFQRHDEFAFGDHLLICPVTRPGAESRWMYLPKGNWYYYWNDQFENGGDDVYVEAPLSQIPIFIKEGAVIPHQPVLQYVNEKRLETLTLHVYYTKGKEQSLLYEDNGANYDYQAGSSSLKTFNVQGTSKKLELAQDKNGKYLQSYSHYNIRIHGLPFTPTTMIIDKVVVPFVTHEEEGQPFVAEVTVGEDFKALKISK